MDSKNNKKLELLEPKMSEELTDLVTFIKEVMSKDIPTMLIDMDFLLLSIFEHRTNKMYQRINKSMTSAAIESIRKVYNEKCNEKALSAVKHNRVPSFDDNVIALFNRAAEEATQMNSPYTTSEHLLLAILSDEGENSARKLFDKVGITYGMAKEKIKNGDGFSTIASLKGKNPENIRIINVVGSEEEKAKFLENIINGMDVPPVETKKPKSKGNNNIKSYCTNLNDLVKQGKMDPLIGREKETNEIIRILGRKKKNNAILLGGEGVGKTAIGENLAYLIENGEVPSFLIGKKVVSFDMTALMAGTTLRGMFEERVKGILDEIKNDPTFILFMDNIGAILADKGKNDYEISSMLARALENGEIQVIGTSDFISYRKTFDKDPSLARRFQKIIVEAPTIDESLEILRGLVPSYEKHHMVKYEPEAVDACVTLANRYMTERNLPDSAIDILDEVGAFKGTIQESPYLKEMRMSMIKMEKDLQAAKDKEDYKKADEINLNLKGTKKAYSEAKSANDKERKNNPVIITKDDILNMVSTKTKIPVSNLTSDDKQKLIHMSDRLKADVIGQDEAIETICKALKRNRIGLHNSGCMYSCMEIGKTGVGKTYMAKKLAKELFGDENALIRIDMSEYSDKTSVNKLIGSTPGYVGYEEGGHLTESIKNKKHCVLLLDEIEKADPEVYNIFLQVLDEGFLTDNSGMKVDFKNVIVIFTSNVGAKAANDFSRGIGFNDDKDANSKRILLKELKNRFPPEFLNRIGDVIYFNSLTDDNLKSIIRLEISKLEERLSKIGYSMECDESVIEYILSIVKDEKDFGARPINRAIQNIIEDKITDSILENNYDNGYTFKISCCDLCDVVVA